MNVTFGMDFVVSYTVELSDTRMLPEFYPLFQPMLLLYTYCSPQETPGGPNTTMFLSMSTYSWSTCDIEQEVEF